MIGRITIGRNRNDRVWINVFLHHPSDLADSSDLYPADHSDTSDPQQTQIRAMLAPLSVRWTKSRRQYDGAVSRKRHTPKSTFWAQILKM